nr:hypothetical protein Q903MT_gene2953 [Picea sitchensis]
MLLDLLYHDAPLLGLFRVPTLLLLGLISIQRKDLISQCSRAKGIPLLHGLWEDLF